MEEVLTRASFKSSGQEQQARPSSSAARLKGRWKGVSRASLERRFLAPTLVAGAIVLMRFAFRISNHFGSLPVPLTIFSDMTQISVP
jgi:hypothetical protein